LNYGKNEAVTISLTVRFDNALQTNGAGNADTSGLGINVGRAFGGTATTGIGS
jgi:hypothetical protein